MENASENLQLFKTDLLDCEGLSAAIVGCMGVFHVASPVPDKNVPVANPEASLSYNYEKLLLNNKLFNLISQIKMKLTLLLEWRDYHD